MEYTGERMVPEGAGNSTFWEHIYRYRFAVSFAKGKDVLDIACGEGYGTAALKAAEAKDVLGVDISEEACRHAAAKYSVSTRAGSAMAIPCENGSRDLIVSFETIEHLESPEQFIDEACRVLRPDGILIVSTPNRDVYHEIDPNNKFHVSELSEAEFLGLLHKRFKRVDLLVQSPRRCRWWSPYHLAADVNLLSGIRGYRRAIRLLRRIFCPHIVENDHNQKFRADPVATILSPNIPDRHFMNPYGTRLPSQAQGITPAYLVAVCYRQPN